MSATRSPVSVRARKVPSGLAFECIDECGFIKRRDVTIENPFV